MRRQTFSNTSATAGVGRYYEYSLDRSLGRVDRVSLRNVTNDQAYDETFNNYDFSGNLESWYQGVSEQGAWNRFVDARSYYGMDERLRALQKYEIVPTTQQGRTSGLFEEYRYDPLGRRVAVLTRRPNAICNQPQQCYTSTTFFVWAGDNLLWEIKDTNGNGTAAPPPESSGTVSYFHAGGIDRPLVIWKNTVGSIVTHQNWRGQFARGTWGEGTVRVGQSSDCTGTWPQQNPPCVPVPWPGWNTTAWHEDAAKPQTVGTDTYWLGSLSVGMRDASGQMYMRNRYYNPQTGQFTQPDPIGLAGGLNSYGFAGGDPVSYSDPYGLKIYCDAKTKVNNQSGCDLYEELRTRVNQGLRSDDQDVRAGARRLAGMLNAMNADEDRHYVVTAGVLPDNSGAGIEVAVPGRAGWWAAIVDPSQSPNNPRQEVSASPWILVAHELGGARSRSLGGGHAAGSIPAENGARMIAGCRKRWLHKGDTFVTHPGCYR